MNAIVRSSSKGEEFGGGEGSGKVRVRGSKAEGAQVTKGVVCGDAKRGGGETTAAGDVGGVRIEVGEGKLDGHGGLDSPVSVLLS